MRRLLSAILVLAAAAGPAAAQEWVEHRPPGIGYRIEMPEAPKQRAQDVPSAAGPIKAVLAFVDRGNVGFIVSHSDYPASAFDGRSMETVLDDIVKGQVGRNTLREQGPIAISGRPGRAAVIDGAQGLVIVTRAVLVETRLFQAIYVGPKGSETGDDAKRFLGSFALVER